MIEFAQLSYRYPDQPQVCLDQVSLALPAGSFTLVIGPSGSGKSTLLRCLNGLVPHFSGGEVAGSVRVAAYDPIALGPRVMSRHVGMVFQSPEAQFVLERVEDEIAFALEHAAVPREQLRIRVEEVLDLLDLAPLRDRLLTTLSGGERQRVAIAATLALQPMVLVLDEPTSQLDPQSADDVLQALVRLNHDLGLTIVLAEHRSERVLPIVDLVVALDRAGRVVSGPPREILANSPLCPPLVTVARAAGWQPLPLSIKEARPFATRQGLAQQDAIAVGKTGEAGRASETGSPRPPRPYLEIRGLEAGYGTTPVLRNLDLTIAAGEITLLMGRNGIGKSTLLKCMIGLVRPRRGEIRIAGRSIAGRDIAAISRELACLPQEPESMLFADTVADELRTTLRNHRLPVNEALIDELLAQLGLSERRERYPRDLSIGERQRVALGAISITRPGGLLLDEPTRGLDYEAKAMLGGLLRQWSREGTAIIVVSHDVEFVAEIADRVLILGQGGLIADGTPWNVLGNSPLFAPQIARIFPGRGWLTASDALQGLQDK
ncbi:ABC transporter ATP-binding protein [Candidatus Chloroploca sp. Khr17]|uniref:ABC transporter ATP-binding protein n=1 Tax=Candidatus Chloroploca sp. Khr17 TaxID=2496869 RepID=UPI00101D72E3|nr:ABC transporter ATP-binding protein [Candidatus Chloroploca sp. Khr17]